jgi:hypothetical protein
VSPGLPRDHETASQRIEKMSAPKHTWSVREAVRAGAKTREEAAAKTGLPEDALRPAWDFVREVGQEAPAPKPRIARCSIATVWANCAKCGEGLTDPNGGSLNIGANAADSREMTCLNCGTLNRLPKWVAERT